MKQRPAKLDDLLALNDEIAGLIRAGLPLELGLRQLSSSAAGGLSKLSARLAERVSIGSSLEQALREEGDHLPSVYLAVVEAGMRIYELYSYIDGDNEHPIGNSMATQVAQTITGTPPPRSYYGPWALETMGGAGGQTIAGVVSTATHGGDVVSGAIRASTPSATTVKPCTPPPSLWWLLSGLTMRTRNARPAGAVRFGGVKPPISTRSVRSTSPASVVARSLGQS